MIPSKNGKPLFASSKTNSLWVMLLEKAWAKVNSSYMRVNYGFPD